MAVMRTFCGCISTKTGTILILVVYGLLYVSGIVLTSLTISQLNQLGTDPVIGLAQGCGLDPAALNTTNPTTTAAPVIATATTTAAITNTSVNSLSLMLDWWCGFGVYFAIIAAYYGLYIAIVILVLKVVLLLLTCIALYGAATDRACLMLPAIIAEFLVWLKFLILLVATIFLLTYIGGLEVTTIIFIAAVGAFSLVYLMYLWLCLVGHYQTLREIAKMNHEDKVHMLQDDPRFGHDYDGYDGFDGATPPPDYAAAANPGGYNELDGMPNLDAKLE